MLITTRMREAGPQAQSEVLPVLSRYEGVLFLLRRARKIGHRQVSEQATRHDIRLAKELYQLMDGLPLALDQAGAYMAENGVHCNAIVISTSNFAQTAGPSTSLRYIRPLCAKPSAVLANDSGCNALAGKALQFCAFLAPCRSQNSSCGLA